MQAQPQHLHRPIGVFDAGIGSYAMVQAIRRQYPLQDILYFADRASFPYGSKSHEQLSQAVLGAIGQLAGLGAAAVVLASNAPSVMVLESLQGSLPVPVLGIYPPVHQALSASRTGQVAVLGVQSLVASAEIRGYIDREAAGRPVHLANASPLVALVEDGRFLADPAGTQQAVNAFMAQLHSDVPGLDTCTLSSTHLPWLAPFFRQAAPGVQFLDPAEALLPSLLPHVSAAGGCTVCIATESPTHPLSGLQRMFSLLGVQADPILVPAI